MSNDFERFFSTTRTCKKVDILYTRDVQKNDILYSRFLFLYLK